MNKIDLVKQVASEGSNLKRKIINHIADDDPQSQVTVAAITQLFANLNELIQNAKIRNGDDNAEQEKTQPLCPLCQADLAVECSVIRDYVNKSVGEDEEDVSAYGHYDEEGDFVSDSFEGFGGKNFDLLDDSDKCESCNGQL